MGLFGIKTAAPRRSQSQRDAVAVYKRLAPQRLQLNNKLIAHLSRAAIKSGAKRLGILRGDALVLDHDDQMSVLMDYCIYDVYNRGRNTVDQFLCESTVDPDSDEMILLGVMQHATYALIAVREVESGVGCKVENLFTEESLFLIDIGLSMTAKPGLVIATRVLDFGDFVTTSGAALPVGVLDDQELAAWQRELHRGRADATFDPAPLIRQCFQAGSSDGIAYVDAGRVAELDFQNTQARVANGRERRRALERLRKTSPTTTRRCDCGSGKMFKNCCGRT